LPLFKVVPLQIFNDVSVRNIRASVEHLFYFFVLCSLESPILIPLRCDHQFVDHDLVVSLGSIETTLQSWFRPVSVVWVSNFVEFILGSLDVWVFKKFLSSKKCHKIYPDEAYVLTAAVDEAIVVIVRINHVMGVLVAEPSSILDHW
jgi:hypothetical protein